MDDRMVDMIFQGALDPTLPPVSSKIVRIFTSSTFTGMCVCLNSYVIGVLLEENEKILELRCVLKF